MKTDFLTPVGRLVQGDPFEAQTKNMQGQPLVTMSGQPTQRYFIAVAFRKDDANFGAFYQKLVEVARGSFPNLLPGGSRRSIQADEEILLHPFSVYPDRFLNIAFGSERHIHIQNHLYDLLSFRSHRHDQLPLL